MQRTVHEYPIDPGLTRIPCCPDAIPLGVGLVTNQPVIWVEVSPELDHARIMTIAMVNNGGRVPTMGTYLGTVCFTQGGEVFPDRVPDNAITFTGHVYTSME